MSLEVGEGIGATKVGDAIDFPVPRHNAHGRMVVVSEQPIGDCPCKQVRWLFTRDGETRESPRGVLLRPPRLLSQALAPLPALTSVFDAAASRCKRTLSRRRGCSTWPEA